MTNQEAFTKMVQHLRAQGCKAEHNNVCSYRMKLPDGRVLKCAIGALIPDEEYSEDLEGKTVDDWQLIDLPSLHGLDFRVLGAMQRVHDDHEPEAWEGKFASVAVCYGLELPKPA